MAAFFAMEVNFSVDPSLPCPRKLAISVVMILCFQNIKLKTYLLKSSIHTEEDSHHKYTP